MSSENQTIIDPDDEAKTIALFYRTMLDELHDNRLAEILTIAYVQSFVRRTG